MCDAVHPGKKQHVFMSQRCTSTIFYCTKFVICNKYILLGETTNCLRVFGSSLAIVRVYQLQAEITQMHCCMYRKMDYEFTNVRYCCMLLTSPCN